MYNLCIYIKYSIYKILGHKVKSFIFPTLTISNFYLEHSVHLRFSALLLCNWHTVSCTYLKYTTW